MKPSLLLTVVVLCWIRLKTGTLSCIIVFLVLLARPTHTPQQTVAVPSQIDLERNRNIETTQVHTAQQEGTHGGSSDWLITHAGQTELRVGQLDTRVRKAKFVAWQEELHSKAFGSNLGWRATSWRRCHPPWLRCRW